MTFLSAITAKKKRKNMSARFGFVEARARLVDKQAAGPKAKDEAKERSTLLKAFGIKESKPDKSIPIPEAGNSRMTSRTQRQDRLGAPTRDPGTMMGTLVRPELD